MALEASRSPRPPSRSRAHQKAGHEAALLLRDALVLSLRRGAGPFRSFGQIAVEPRAYQLVPLLMALKLGPGPTAHRRRVGIGKTIEAALIARELLDRGDVDRFAVLCPPHLVDQWVTELDGRFHLRPVAVTAASASRLEEGFPGESISRMYPHTVVSLDYIKSERRRASSSACARVGHRRRGSHLRGDRPGTPSALRATQGDRQQHSQQEGTSSRDADSDSA